MMSTYNNTLGWFQTREKIKDNESTGKCKPLAKKKNYTCLANNDKQKLYI